MILINVQRDQVHEIIAFSVIGHAEYAESGKDIVCAGVSAITIGTVNAVEALLQIELEHSMNKGLLSVSVPEILDEALKRNVQLLLESMIVMLDTIQQTYGKYISIKTKSGRR